MGGLYDGLIIMTWQLIGPIAAFSIKFQLLSLFFTRENGETRDKKDSQAAVVPEAEPGAGGLTARLKKFCTKCRNRKLLKRAEAKISN